MREGICQQCGRTMPIPANVRVKRWCSSRCKSASISWRYSHYPRFQHAERAVVAVTCIGCGADFMKDPALVHKRYCTPRCCKSAQDRRTYKRRVARLLLG